MVENGNASGLPDNTENGSVEQLKQYLAELDRTKEALEAGTIDIDEARAKLKDIAEKQAGLSVGAITAPDEPRSPEQTAVAIDTTAEMSGGTAESLALQGQNQAAGVAEVFHGEVELAMMPPVDSKMFIQFQKQLRLVEGLKIVMVSGSVGKSSSVFVSAAQPLPLLDKLGCLPEVERLENSGTGISVWLKSSPVP